MKGTLNKLMQLLYFSTHYRLEWDPYLKLSRNLKQFEPGVCLIYSKFSALFGGLVSARDDVSLGEEWMPSEHICCASMTGVAVDIPHEKGHVRAWNHYFSICVEELE